MYFVASKLRYFYISGASQLNDSLDDFISQSQADNQEVEDSFDDQRVNQASPKSKVEQWLSQQDPQSIEKANREKFPVVRRKLLNNPFQVENRVKTGDTGSVQDQIMRARLQRQAFIFNYFAREQDLDLQQLDLMKKGKLN